MGTRSQIIVALAAGGFKAVYCHWDGYIEHNGRILHTHYNSQELAESLVSLGDLSSLGEVVGEKHDFDWQDDFTKKYSFDFEKMHADPEYIRLKAMCSAYGRDRGEADTEARAGADLKAVWPGKDSWCEYVYVWKDGQWFVSKSTIGRLRPLAKSPVLKKALRDAERALKDEAAKCAAA